MSLTKQNTRRIACAALFLPLLSQETTRLVVGDPLGVVLYAYERQTK